MGKGKRNRQNHLDVKVSSPDQYREKKKPARHMPKWASRTICIAVVVLVIAAILLAVLAENGFFLRTRILVKSTEGYSLNQQMATFIVWQNLYQQFYQDWYYSQWGLSGSNSSAMQGYSSAAEYAFYTAGSYVQSIPRDVIESYGDYLSELVAGADAGVRAGLKLDKYDQVAIDEMVDWVENLKASIVGENANTDAFLDYYITDKLSLKDVRDAAELMAMYTKFCDYTKYNLDFKEDQRPTENELISYIHESPVNHFKAVYRSFVVANEEQAKKFEDVKTEKEFTDLVVDILLENNLDSLILDVYASSVANKDKDALTTAKNKDEATLQAKLAELGIVSAEYKKTASKVDGKDKITYSPEIASEISAWIFDTKRVDKDFAVVTGKESVYLIYVFKKPATAEGDANSTVVSAGWKEYKLSDFKEETKDFAALLKKDLISEKREDTTDYKSSEDYAKEILESLKKSKKDITEELKKEFLAITAVKTGVTTTKPSQSSSSGSSTKQDAPDAILDKLYESGTKVGDEEYYQADDGAGNSYIIRVKEISGTTYKIDYATVTDSDYYSLFRTLKAELDSDYPSTAPSMTYPTLPEDENTFEHWLFASKLTEASGDTPANRTFTRKPDEVKWFKKTTTNSTTGAKTDVYTAYIVVKSPVENERKTDATAYGGYLKYNSKADAEAAYNELKELSDFNLWCAFKSLSVTTPATTEGASDTITNATLETKIEKSSSSIDETVRNWFFAEGRAFNDLAVIQGKDGSYYLVHYKTLTPAWLRDYKDEWIVAKTAEILDEEIAAGGYQLITSALDAIGAPTVTESGAAE